MTRKRNVGRLRSAFLSAGAALPAAFEKVSVRCMRNPDADWATWGPAGEPPVWHM